MNGILHFIAAHWIRILTTWFLLGVGFVAFWAIYCELHGESDEQRDERRRRESRARTHARLNAIAEEYKRRERAKHEALMKKIVDGAVESLGVAETVTTNSGQTVEDISASANGRRSA